MATTQKQIVCNFCGKTQDQVERIIIGPGVNICNECVELCVALLNEEGVVPRARTKQMSQAKKSALGNIKILTPEEIKRGLDAYVVGQDDAKISLAVTVYNHYKRILSANDLSDVELQKSNILMIGPSGVGKTFLAQTLAKLINVPFAIADATTLTEAGYVGEDVENILLKLIQAADYDIEKAEKGIIFIDEIDKITRKSENPSITRDVGGEGVQQALLKIVEGTVAGVPPQGGRKHPQEELIQINTKNILFICGGAFDGLDKIIERRTNANSLGFGNKIKENTNEHTQNLIKQVEPHDVVKFGIIPELVGRLPVIAALSALDEQALVQILVEPKNSIIKQYKALLALDNVDIEFTDDALSAIAKKAIELKNGARGLRTIIEKALKTTMYTVPSDNTIIKVTVDEKVILEGAEPHIGYGAVRKRYNNVVNGSIGFNKPV